MMMVITIIPVNMITIVAVIVGTVTVNDLDVHTGTTIADAEIGTVSRGGIDAENHGANNDSSNEQYISSVHGKSPFSGGMVNERLNG